MPRRRRWYSKDNSAAENAAAQEGQPSGEAPVQQNSGRPHRPRKNNQPRPAAQPQSAESPQNEQAASAQSEQRHARRPRRNNQPPQRQPRLAAPPAEGSQSPEAAARQQNTQNQNRPEGSQRRSNHPQGRGRRNFTPGAENTTDGERSPSGAEQQAGPQNQSRGRPYRQDNPARDQAQRGKPRREPGQRQGQRRTSPQEGLPDGIAQAPRQQGQPRRGPRPDNRRERRPDTRSPFSEFTMPIPTNKGIKARSQRGTFSKNWWARRWIEAMEQLVDPHRLQRGRSYARQGQVLSIEETPVGIEAKVQGSRPQPYKVTMQLTPLTDEQWDEVISALAEQAIFTAQLLAGEMPEDIEAAFLRAGVSLFPYQAGDLFTDCTCPDWANPCKHVAASHYILGDRFDDDPFLLFRMRGRNQEQILQALRERRSGGAIEEEAPSEPEPVIEESRPLSEEIDHFWEPVESLDAFPLTIRPPTAEMPLLKRLGEPAFLGGGSIEEILRPVYNTFSRSAFRAAYSEEEPLESANGNGNGIGNGNGNGIGDTHEPDSDDVVDGTGRRPKPDSSQESDETSLY